MKISFEVSTIEEALFESLSRAELENISSNSDIEASVNCLKAYFDEIVKDFEKALRNDNINAFEYAVNNFIKSCCYEQLTEDQVDFLDLDIDNEYYKLYD